eukprot:m.23991 g.23991  ORF g.23991 m.23991 type:complete len:69 (-) comp14443_c1_seq1:147-353(-)
MAATGKNLGTFDKAFTYKIEGPAKKDKKKALLKGTWKPISNARGMVTSSITAMNATRSMTRSNYMSKM